MIRYYNGNRVTASANTMRHRHFFLATCAFTIINGSPAWGQASPQVPAVSGQETAATHPRPSSGMDDIVVTARRREESSQNVPVAITAFSQRTLEQKSIFNAFDLSKAVPGLTVSSENGVGTQGDFSIRGRGQFFGAATGSVATYFADVPINSNFSIPGLPPQFFDLQSVQVLKGPQGTLFGRNTTGGAVLFVPAAPTDELGGYVRLQGGTYNDFQFEAAVNLPFNDKVMLRIAAFDWQRKGYTRTTGGFTDPYGKVLPPQRYDNQDVTEARATLLVKPTDTFANSTIFTYHTDQNRGSTQVNIVNKATAAGAGVAFVYPQYATDGPRLTENDVDLRRPASSTFAVINTSTLDLSDSLTLKNIFGFIKAEGYVLNPDDTDGSPLPIVDLPIPAHALRNQQTTDEVQLQGNFLDARLTTIVGGLIDLTRQPGSLSKINIFTNSFQGGSWDEQFAQSHYTSKSLFGSFTYKLTDALSVSGGIRHSWDDIKDRHCEYDPATPAASAAACATTVGFDVGEHKFKGFSYNAGVEWRPSTDTMLYGGYRRGYKRGGFNAKGTGLSLFAPETVDDFYAGVKQDLSLFGMRGHLNVEGFYDLYHDAQRSYLAFDPSVGALSTQIQNAPKSTYRGFDMDFVIEPARWLTLSGNYTFVDAFYNKFPDNTCANGLCFVLSPAPGFVPVAAIQAENPGDQSDNPLGVVSKHKFSVTARLHTELADGSEIAFAPTVSYQSRFFFNDQAFRQPNAGAGLFGPVNSAAAGADYAPKYALVDLRIEWNKVAGSNFDLALNGNNLLNKTFVTGGAGIYQLGINNVSYGPPRMATVDVRYHF